MGELNKRFKYIFLDIVKFTQRSVEAQSDVVKALNEIVKSSVETNAIKEENIIYIPTGDGICLAMSGELAFDIHMRVAINILKNIHNYNVGQTNDMHKFNVRIGVNENIDNIIEDINGRVNVAGSGINIASRVMDNADGGQILVSESVYDILHSREKYIQSFKSYTATIKHGIKIPVHQYINKGIVGLNTDTPESLSSKKTVYFLSKKSAYYFAHAIKNREILIVKTKGDSMENTPVVLLWYLADDSCEMSKCKDFDGTSLKQPGDGKLSIEEQYDVIGSTYYWILTDIHGFIVRNHLEKFHQDSFEDDRFGMKCWFIINQNGQHKLKKEHPEIWHEFNLDEYVK